jgi:Putative auto-transporter adhesin, head GIN domain
VYALTELVANWRQALAALVLIAAPAAARERIVTVTSFDRIRIEGPYQVEIITDRGPSARVTGSDNALERVTVVNQGLTLIVRPKRTGWGGMDGEDAGPVTVRLTTPSLRAVAVTGAASVRVDRMRNASVAVALEGGGTLAVAAIETDALDVGLAGAGQMTLGGRAAGGRFAVRGTANLVADKLSVRDAKVISEGAGNIALAAVRTAEVTTSGAGNVTVTGSPACTVNRRGSGTVVCGAARR